ncbi:uncharacterized protein L201_006525 [Kwoniella dendrophila CBS 6074]|uniref:Uncharacterized protein n=1 Tax=Kwoniella dendrophila CBS 6074 TaxID=1295534 RepID=A0AAX4K327_9TREE
MSEIQNMNKCLSGDEDVLNQGLKEETIDCVTFVISDVIDESSQGDPCKINFKINSILLDDEEDERVTDLNSLLSGKSIKGLIMNDMNKSIFGKRYYCLSASQNDIPTSRSNSNDNNQSRYSKVWFDGADLICVYDPISNSIVNDETTSTSLSSSTAVEGDIAYCKKAVI